jgi:hypothetical protein
VWRAPPLDYLAGLLGDAPLRVAAAGPFERAWSTGLGGLLAAATGAGLAARPDADAVQVTLVLAGPWGDRADQALERLRHAYSVLVGSGLGRLLGLEVPAGAPVFTSASDWVRLDVRLRIVPLLRGIRDATTAQVEAIMKRPPE